MHEESASTRAEFALYRGLTGLYWPRVAPVASAANGVTAALSFLF
jgi:hypothetical protein